MQSAKFWNDKFLKGQADSYSRVEMPDLNNPIYRRALEHFGDVEGKTVIDLGCGRGATSLLFAHYGAKVISVDLSEASINNLSSYCLENNIDNIKPVNVSAFELSKKLEEKADFVFGSMILHHLEPFSEIAKEMREITKEGGKCFFWENNARSKIMIWFREHVVGRLWVPKYGDPDEFPLMPDEVDELRKYFRVEVEFPNLHYFRMISSYLLRGHLSKPFELLDKYFYRYPPFRQHSYFQYLLLS